METDYKIILLKEVTVMADESAPHFLITHKEEELLQQLRELSDDERKEVEKKLLEAALKYAEWGE